MVSIGYKKKQILHSDTIPKGIGKPLTHGSKCALVRECFKDAVVSMHITDVQQPT